MSKSEKHPNADKTRVLQMRINPDGRTFMLHPKDLDLEYYVQTHGGRTTVKMLKLLARNSSSLDDRTNREYHKVKD